MASVSYVKGAELPPLNVQLLNESNSVIDLTTASAITLRLGLDTTTTALTKTTGITGSTSGATINWTSGELDLTPGNYIAELTATIGGLDYRRQFTLVIDQKLA